MSATNMSNMFILFFGFTGTLALLTNVTQAHWHTGALVYRHTGSPAQSAKGMKQRCPKYGYG